MSAAAANSSFRQRLRKPPTGHHAGFDVPTYVEYGAADVGITGKDTLMEYGGGARFYERLDLGIGRCRLMTAAPPGVDLSRGPLRVATKFVNVTRRYFESRGQQAAIIPLVRCDGNCSADESRRLHRRYRRYG